MPKLMQLFCKRCQWEIDPGSAHCNTSKCPICGEQTYIRPVVVCPKCNSHRAIVLIDTYPELWECLACDYILTERDLTRYYDEKG